MKIQDLLFKCAEKIAQYGFTDRVDGKTIQLIVCRGAQRVIDLENMLIAEREEKRRFELLAKDLNKQLEDATAQMAGRVDYKEQWDGYINNKFNADSVEVVELENQYEVDITTLTTRDVVKYLANLLRSKGLDFIINISDYDTCINILVTGAKPIFIPVMTLEGNVNQLFERIMKIVKEDSFEAIKVGTISGQEWQEKDK